MRAAAWSALGLYVAFTATAVALVVLKGAGAGALGALDRVGGVDRLVGAVERADAEVDDADGGPLGERRARRAAEAAQGRWLEAWQPAGRHEAVTIALCRPSALGVTASMFERLPTFALLALSCPARSRFTRS